MRGPDIKKSPYKVFIYYAVVALVIFGILSCIGLLQVFSVQGLFFLLLLVYFMAGTLHLFLTRYFFPDLTPGKSLAFVSLLTVLGALAVFLLNYFVFGKTTHGFFAFALLVFPLPFLFVYSLRLYLDIPARIYRKWLYPLNQPMPNLDLLDLSHVLIIQFEFLKSTRDPSATNFKAKAPVSMPFGDLFYIFINDYNESHPQNTIEITDAQQKPFSWVFYRKTSWWKSPAFIDPDLNFHENGIENNAIIFCQRTEA